MVSFLHMAELTDHAIERLSAVDSELWAGIHADILNGDAQLFSCPHDTFLVLRIEENELVVVACVGQGGIAIMETVIELARVNGLETVRLHTARIGLPRLIKQFNPVEIERVYRVYVNEN